ncbi:MAG TPA: hypothetical protein VHE34_27725 [Puia sp.]|uniref:DUF983 domain-containing protein n=1 Tax=Puia sp. TaxID=2045100 RepID=UPI002C02F233|nr:DUF983 domain-containing protein [Puia sp.]HVU99055.1 hypothetical protein [Puia sp.]
MNQPSSSKKGYLSAVLHNKCPRCREGDLFADPNPYHLKKGTRMHAACPVCGQPTEIERGFYYGTGYVSYALSVALSTATFVAWWVLVGFSLHDARFFWWIGINAALLVILQPLLMRLSRSLWISWFVHYDPEWKEHISGNGNKVLTV